MKKDLSSLIDFQNSSLSSRCKAKNNAKQVNAEEDILNFDIGTNNKTDDFDELFDAHDEINLNNGNKYNDKSLYVTESEFSKLDSEQQLLVLNNFNHYGHLYISKSVPKKSLIRYVCDHEFPDGICLSDHKNIVKLNEYYKNMFGSDLSIKDERVLSAYLTSSDYILCGQDTLINKKNCPKISDNLLSEITNFINENMPTVYYSTIYEQFKNELMNDGVTNRWMLKGIIDPHLPAGVKILRNYISKIEQNGNYKKGWEHIADYFRELSSSGPFSISEINKEFPDAKKSSILNIINKEVDSHFLLNLSNDEYVYIQDAHVETSDAMSLLAFVQNIFENYKYPYLNVSIVYSRLKLEEPELLERLGVAGRNETALFSLIRALGEATHLFVTNKPFISQGKPIPDKYIDIVYDYVKDLDMFTSKTINNFNKQNSVAHCDFLALNDLASVTHVLIDEETMVKKELLPITDEQIVDIKNVIDPILRRNDIIYTKDFNAYSSFPRLKYKWNKHFMAGIIRTYFPSEYKVSCTGTTIAKTEYEIRRAL